MSIDLRLPRRRGVSLGPVAMRWHARAVVGAGITVAVLLAAVLVALTSGSYEISPARALSTLFGGGTTIEQYVVIDRRLMRVGAAVLIGAALGAAGALTQTVTRNPIATPDILGVTMGASAAAVFLVTQPTLLRGLGSPQERLAIAAIIGSIAATALIIALSWRGGFDGPRLVLVGIGVSAVCGSAVTWMLSRSGEEEAAVAAQWLVGSIQRVKLGDLPILAVTVVVALVICTALTRDLHALRLGRESAPLLGSSPARTEAVAILIAVVLVGVATSVAGPIAFVAFVAPQAAMRLLGTPGPSPVAGALVGATMLLLADLIGQKLWVSLSAGIITPIVGAPFLLHLLIRHQRRSRAH